jgi:OmpR-family two-component system manganese-sensing sensor histidine kinase
MFQATRRRLALWYTIVTAVLLLFFATGFYWYVRNTLVDRIDDTLKHVVEVIDRSLVIESVTPAEGKYRVNVEASFRDNTKTVEDDHIDLEWFNPGGELLWSTLSEPIDFPLSAHNAGKTVHIGGDRLLRQVTKRIDYGRYTLGYLRVSHPWFEVTKPIRQLIIDLTLGLIIIILGVAAIGWLLSGIAIKPVIDSYQSLKQFTADASHELRNPIAMIQTNVQMLLNYPDNAAALQQRQLKVIERLTQRLGNLVNDLLFLARSDSGMLQVNYQTVPLDALLIEVIEEQRILAEQKNIFLSLRIPEPPIEHYPQEKKEEELFNVKGDWEQLARLFTNLISNALAHSRPKNNQELSVEVELQLVKKDRHSFLQVKVKDNGQGISEESLPHIFDRFYRLDPSRSHTPDHYNSQGTGLGLAIAQAIAVNHHGNITVESSPNQGTTLTVTLPE